MNIPYGKQDISIEDINSVVEVLRSDFLTQGPTIEIFENNICNYVGGQFAVATNSATSALHIACLALGLSEGDRLWTSPNSFVASANCGLYCGATIDFVDIDSQTYNMNPELLEEKLIEAEKDNTLPKIVIPVNYAGQSCDLLKIKKLADKYKFYIIEDASHSIGGMYRDKKIGSCYYSDITVFSFHPVKIITTGEGGISITNNPILAEKMRILRSHGITRNINYMPITPDGDWHYQQIDLGFNYRMTDIHAILGCSQLKRIDQFVSRRNLIAKYYNERLRNLPIVLPYQAPYNYSSFHLYPILLQKKDDRKRVFELLRANRIGVNVHYIPIHTQPYYKNLGFKYGDFPNAEQFYSSTISLPIYYSLTEEEQEFVIKILSQIL